MKAHNLDTTGWNETPFIVNGVSYISKIAPTSPFMKKIEKLPYGAWQTMNIGAIRDLIGTVSDRNEILAKIAEINQGATHAVIELK
jgi:hypothetical protein